MATRTEINNRQDIIDSRDVIARITDLESDLEVMHARARDDWQQAGVEADDEPPADFDEWLDLASVDDDDARELLTLRAIAEQAEGYAADWRHGEALIRDSYFRDYAEQLAEDIGAIKKDQGWPYTCINWDDAAEELKADYTCVDFDGVEYWIR